MHHIGSNVGMTRTGLLTTTDLIAMSGNVFRGDRYVMPDCEQPRWYWTTPSAAVDVSHSGTFAAWKARGGRDTDPGRGPAGHRAWWRGQRTALAGAASTGITALLPVR